MFRQAIKWVRSNRDLLIDVSDQIWEFAETALLEHKSAKLLADYAEKQGFSLERGVAGMPTAFIAGSYCREPTHRSTK